MSTPTYTTRHEATDANVDTIGNMMHMDIAYTDNDDDDALSTDSRPTSLREFFQGFWAEFKGRAKADCKELMSLMPLLPPNLSIRMLWILSAVLKSII